MEDQERGNPKPKYNAWERELHRKKCPLIELPHHLVEKILEKLPVKTLIRFKCVSKEWKLSIMSQHFKERQLINQRSHDPNIIFVQREYRKPSTEVCLNTLTLSSSGFVENPSSYYPLSGIFSIYVTKSCDGLLCVYDFLRSIYVINPSIKWYRSLPLSRLQKLLLDNSDFSGDTWLSNVPLLGLGRDNINGEYKLVWLYNVAYADNITTTSCEGEVFSFNTNTWRNVAISFPYLVLFDVNPIYLDGSLHWLSDIYDSERRILSFNLTSETFEVELKTPCNTSVDLALGNMNDHLCISEMKNRKQDIWLLNSDKMWEKIHSIDVDMHFSWFFWQTEFANTNSGSF